MHDLRLSKPKGSPTDLPNLKDPQEVHSNYPCLKKWSKPGGGDYNEKPEQPPFVCGGQWFGK